MTKIALGWGCQWRDSAREAIDGLILRQTIKLAVIGVLHLDLETAVPIYPGGEMVTPVFSMGLLRKRESRIHRLATARQEASAAEIG